MSDKRTATDVDLTREVSVGTVAKFATLVVGFVGSIVFARILGPAGYGGFYLLLALVQIAERGVSGWAIAGQKRFSEDVTESLRREIVGAALAGVLVTTLAGAIFAWVLRGSLESYVGVSGAVGPFVALLFGATVYTTLKHTTAGRGLVSVTNWGETLQTLFAFPIQLGLVLAGFGVAGMAYGYTLGFVLVAPLFLYFTAVRPTVPSLDVLSSLVAFAKYSAPSALLGRVYTRVDVIILGFLVGPAAAGYYEVAFRISIPATFIAAVVAPAVMSRTSERSSRGAEVREDVRNALSYSAVLAIPIFFGAVVIADRVVVTLYGPEYARASTLLVGLALYRIVRSQSAVLINVIQGLDRPDVTLRLSAVTIAINVPLGVVLTLEYGAIGVVIATVVAEAMRYAGLVVVATNWIETRDLFPKQIAQQLLSATVMMAVVGLVLRVVRIRSWVSLVLVVALGAAVYGVVLLAVSVQHRRVVADVLSGFGLVPR